MIRAEEDTYISTSADFDPTRWVGPYGKRASEGAYRTSSDCGSQGPKRRSRPNDHRCQKVVAFWTEGFFVAG